MTSYPELKVNATVDLAPPSLGDLQDGLGGDATAVDVGGIGNLHPYPKLEKYYNVIKIAELCGRPNSFMIGPGAGPHKLVNCNCEAVVNVNTTSNPPAINNYVAQLSSDKSSGYALVQDQAKGDCALMVNLLLTDGQEGEVLKIEASRRTSGENFVGSMRKAIAAKFGDKIVSMGGTFIIKKGTAKIHIMSDFVEGPLTAEEAGKNGWLKFFNMSAPLTCVTVFHSHDPSLDLRMEHTHCFSHHGDGGHYHYDTSPAEVEYVGYLVPAKTLVRIDRP